jgi:hypothetical protein
MSAIETDRGGVKTLVTIIVHSLNHSKSGSERVKPVSNNRSGLEGKALHGASAMMSNGSGNE